MHGDVFHRNSIQCSLCLQLAFEQELLGHQLTQVNNHAER
jgi:hypothetical protein